MEPITLWWLRVCWLLQYFWFVESMYFRVITLNWQHTRGCADENIIYPAQLHYKHIQAETRMRRQFLWEMIGWSGPAYKAGRFKAKRKVGNKAFVYLQMISSTTQSGWNMIISKAIAIERVSYASYLFWERYWFCWFCQFKMEIRERHILQQHSLFSPTWLYVPRPLSSLSQL